MGAKVCNLDPAPGMSTVNEHLTVRGGLRIEVPTLKKGVDFTLLPDSPSIISLGRLCMLDGFSLHWPTKHAPYLIDPSGHRIDLVVDGYVPYISNAQLDTAGVKSMTAASPIAGSSHTSTQE